MPLFLLPSRVMSGALALLFSLVCPPAMADGLTLATWNLEGPTGLAAKDLVAFGEFVRDADIVVLEETLSLDQTRDALEQAGLGNWNVRVSDFAKDSETRAYLKQELAVLSPHRIGKIIEVDPYPNNDTPEMRARDEDFDIPSWIPTTSKGARGWLWVEFPDLKLVVAAVHLKSSQGRSGKADEKNSWKREAVAAGLVTRIKQDAAIRPDWSYVVAGDFNVAPNDNAKIGVDLGQSCTADTCQGYDQTHAIFSAGLVPGFSMRNLTAGLSATYAKGNFVQSPIDNIYAAGPVFDQTTRMVLERGAAFGSDHYAVRVSVDQ